MNWISIIAVFSSLTLMFSGIPELYDINEILPSIILDKLSIRSLSSSTSNPLQRTRTTNLLLPYLVMLIDNYIGLSFSYLIKDYLGFSLRLLGTTLNLIYIITIIYRCLDMSLVDRSSSSKQKMVFFSNEYANYFPVIYFIITHIIAFTLLYSIYNKDTINKQIYYLGILNTLTAISFAVAPLLKVSTIIRTKNATSLSFPTSLALDFCAVSWMIRGIQLKQLWIIFPNALNAILATGQLYLIQKYGSSTSISSSPMNTSGQSSLYKTNKNYNSSLLSTTLPTNQSSNQQNIYSYTENMNKPLPKRKNIGGSTTRSTIIH